MEEGFHVYLFSGSIHEPLKNMELVENIPKPNVKFGGDDDFDDDFDDDLVTDTPPVKAKKASRNKFEDFDDDDEFDDDIVEEAPKPIVPAKKKPAAPKKKSVVAPSRPAAFSLLSDDEDESEEEEASSEPDVRASTRATAFAFDESDSEPEEESDLSEPEPEPEPVKQPQPKLTKAQKKRQKKKQKNQKTEPVDDEFDDILANLGSKPAVAEKKEDGIDAIMASLETSEPAEEKKLSKAQLKRLRKKQKLLEESQPKEEDGEAEEAEVETAGKKKRKRKKKGKVEEEKKKPQSALARRIQEDKQAREAAEAAQRAAIEEEERREKEEEEALVAAERNAKEREQKRKDAKAARKQRLKDEGKYLTAAQRRKKQDAERARQMLVQSGMVPQAGQGQRKKPQYAKKKKGGQRKGASNEEQRMLAMLQEKAKQVEEEAVSEEEDSKNEEVGEVNEKPKPPKESESESGGDWDASDSEGEKEAKPKKKSKKSSWDNSSVSEWDGSGSDGSSSEGNQWSDEEDAALKPKKFISVPKPQPKRKTPTSSPRRDEMPKGKGGKTDASKAEVNGVASPKDAEEKEVDAVGRKAGKKRDLRSPICCVLGHVDAGKTKILDKIRDSSVQDHEVGGITQQIGATFVPVEVIKRQTEELNRMQKKELKYKLPGLLIIDTPGHESFGNLRKRGSTLCDIAIVVVDIMEGLKPQTIESLELLKRQEAPFVVAVNKVDRIYGWKATKDAPIQTTLANQGADQIEEYDRRLREVMLQLTETGLNCELYYKNKDFKNYVSVVPTSAFTGEGLPDLLMLLVQLTQSLMKDRLQYISEVECTVLEVKMTAGLGATIDVVLSNGVLKMGSTIVVCGMNGPIVTQIRALLLPAPLAEMRVKGEFLRAKEVKASIGVKISAPNLDECVAGSQLFVVGPRDDVEAIKDDAMMDLASILSRVDKSGKGVYVQASTLGALEALLQFLADEKIPVSGIAIGDVHKKDIMKASVMLEFQREFACILAFNVKVDRDVAAIAEQMGVQIFQAEIIYHLTDMFRNYLKEIKDARRRDATEAIFPVVLEILPAHIIHKHDPIILGAEVKRGTLKVKTPLVAMVERPEGQQQWVQIGRVDSIENDGVEQSEAKVGDKVAVKIAQGAMEQHIYYGRQFDYKNMLCSYMTRDSIDLLKENFREDLCDDEWRLIIRLKKFFQIM
eukprot:876476_1